MHYGWLFLTAALAIVVLCVVGKCVFVWSFPEPGPHYTASLFGLFVGILASAALFCLDMWLASHV